MTKVLVVDPSKCNNCHSCEEACSTWKEGISDIRRSRIRIVAFPTEAFYYPNACLQCEVPYCALPCPTGAIRKNAETGVVELDQGKCVGCKLCLMSCVSGAIAFPERVAAKCDLCEGDPTCVKFCDRKALKLGEPDEMSAIRRAIVANILRESHMAKTL